MVHFFRRLSYMKGCLIKTVNEVCLEICISQEHKRRYSFVSLGIKRSMLQGLFSYIVLTVCMK